MPLADRVLVQDGDVLFSHGPDREGRIGRKKGIEVWITRAAWQLLLLLERPDMAHHKSQAVTFERDLFGFHGQQRPTGNRLGATGVDRLHERCRHRFLLKPMPCMNLKVLYRS